MDHKQIWCLVVTVKIHYTTLTCNRALIKNQLMKLFPQIQMGSLTQLKETEYQLQPNPASGCTCVHVEESFQADPTSPSDYSQNPVYGIHSNLIKHYMQDFVQCIP